MHNYASASEFTQRRASFDKQDKPLLELRASSYWYMRKMTSIGNFTNNSTEDEPWDSEHNKKLIAMMPLEYRNPASSAAAGKTTYLGVCGNGLMFEGNRERKFSDVTDGLSNTIMVVEADNSRAVTWTEPDNWEFNPDHRSPGWGNAHPVGFHAILCDGGIQTLGPGIDPAVFHAFLTIAGGD